MLRPALSGTYIARAALGFWRSVDLVLCTESDASAARISLAVRRRWFLLPTIAVRRGASIDRYPKRALKASNMPSILLRQSGNPD